MLVPATAGLWVVGSLFDARSSAWRAWCLQAPLLACAVALLAAGGA
jgi:hypothetical protein